MSYLPESPHLFLPLFAAAALFSIGAAGVLMRRSILFILMSLELSLNAVNLSLIAFSRIYGFEDGPLIAFFIMTLAAGEAGVGLALAVRVYKAFKTTDVSKLQEDK